MLAGTPDARLSTFGCAARDAVAPEGGVVLATLWVHAIEMSDLRDRVPGHGLVERLVTEWQDGHIHFDGSRAIVDDEARSWYRGVLGERAVAKQLAALGPDWLVLHSVPVGSNDTDIDHVAIGPGGVFTINSKYSPGRDVWARGYGLYVGGHKTGYVPKALAEARRAATRLSRATGMPVEVTPVLVFVDPGRMSVDGPVGGDDAAGPPVIVTASSDIADAIPREPLLTLEHLERIGAAAIDPRTWHDSPGPDSGLALAAEFDALEDAVGPALAGPMAPPRTTTSRSPRSGTGRDPRRSPANRRRSRGNPVVELLWRLVAAAIAFGILYWMLTTLLPALMARLTSMVGGG